MIDQSSCVTWVIYGLKEKSSNKYRYIGKTSETVYRRLQRHLYDAKHTKTARYVYNWINKVGHENITIKVLEECPIGNKEYLSYAEKYWIAEMKVFGHSLTNSTIGGEGILGHKHTVESKLKMSESTKGMYAGEKNPRYGIKGPLHPMYGIKGEAHPGYGYKASPERIEAMRLFATGRKHTEEAKNKISKANKGIPKSEETKQKLRKAGHKRYHENRDIINTECEFCVPL